MEKLGIGRVPLARSPIFQSFPFLGRGARAFDFKKTLTRGQDTTRTGVCAWGLFMPAGQYQAGVLIGVEAARDITSAGPIFYRVSATGDGVIVLLAFVHRKHIAGRAVEYDIYMRIEGILDCDWHDFEQGRKIEFLAVLRHIGHTPTANGHDQGPVFGQVHGAGRGCSTAP